MPDSAGSKKAAAFSRGTHVERKEFRRRIRLMPRKVSGLLAYIYSIPDFLAGANICRIFLPAAECRILPTAKHHIGRTQQPRCRQRQRGLKTKKGTNTTANPSYVLRKFFFPPLLYIVYQIFRRAQIFVGFFSQPREAWRCRRFFAS